MSLFGQQLFKIAKTVWSYAVGFTGSVLERNLDFFPWFVDCLDCVGGRRSVNHDVELQQGTVARSQRDLYLS